MVTIAIETISSTSEKALEGDMIVAFVEAMDGRGGYASLNND